MVDVVINVTNFENVLMLYNYMGRDIDSDCLIANHVAKTICSQELGM